MVGKLPQKPAKGPQQPAKVERGPRKFNGLALVVALIREADPKLRQALLAKLHQKLPVVERLCNQCAFIYRDIPRLDDRSIQLIFSMVPETEWLIAWKLSDEKVKAFLLSNMTERRREDFLAATKTQQKILKRRVYIVQAQIANRIRMFIENGRLGLRSKR